MSGDRGLEPIAAWRIFAVGVGSNLGDRTGQIGRAFELLSRTPGVRELRCGPLVESEPVLPEGETTPHPDYLNTVFGGETRLGPRPLLARLLAIEAGFGRRRGPGCRPRTLDLDLLVVGDLRVSEPGLELPHPRMWSREFVTSPLRAVFPDLEPPKSAVSSGDEGLSEA